MKKTLLTLVAVLGFCVGQSAQARVSFGIPQPFPFLVWTPSGYSGQGYYGNCGQGGYSGSYYNYPNVGYYGYSGGYYPYPYATGYYRSYYNDNGYYRPYWRRGYNNGYYRRGYYGQRYYYRRGQIRDFSTHRIFSRIATSEDSRWGLRDYHLHQWSASAV